MNVVVLDKVTGSFISSQSFDTHASSANSASLVSFISSLDHGSLVFMAVKDEAQKYLTTAAKNAIKTLGSTKINSIRYRDSWCILGKKGAKAGTAVEDLKPNGVASCSQTIFFPQTISVRGYLQSAGYDTGNFASINLDRSFVLEAYERGMNVVVLDKDSGSIISKSSFDTYDYRYPSLASIELVDFISDLEDGSWVAIAIKDEASYRLSDAAKNVLKQLGSTKVVDSIKYHDSWCIIAQKQDTQEMGKMVVEDHNPNGIASCSRTILFNNIDDRTNDANIQVHLKLGFFY